MNDVMLRRAYITAALCAVAVLVLFPLQMSVFALAWPPPSTAEGWFTLLDERPLVGLLSLDVLLMADWIILIGLWAGLFLALRKHAPRLMLVAMVIVAITTILYFASNTAFQMLALSRDYASTTSLVERSDLLAAGEAAMARFDGWLFTASYVGSGIAAAIVSYVMLKSRAFGRLAAWTGMTYGAMQLIPPNLGTVGMIVSVVSLLPMLLWIALLARAFTRLARETSPRPAGRSARKELAKDSRITGWRRVTAATILILVSINALAAGFGFMGSPDGSALGIPWSWLAGSPFSDYFVPGAILFALGLLYGFAALQELRRRRDAWFWAGLSGGAMIVWIVVQVYFMGYDRHPIQTALQAIVLVAGLVVGFLALTQMRLVRGGTNVQRVH